MSDGPGEILGRTPKGDDVTMAYHCCDDVAVHSHDGGKTLRRNGRPYDLRFAFEWRRPKALVYTAATRRHVAVHLNRYPGAVIGVALQVGSRVLSIMWGRPGQVIETT